MLEPSARGIALRIVALVAVLFSASAFTGCATRRTAEVPPDTMSAAPGSLNLSQMLVPPGRYGRHKEFSLRPKYITIHSTGNSGATALQHARGMARGAFRGRSNWNRTGYMTWHFTVDDREAIQSLPLSIQGEHADHDGPGNKSSIAIEICEFRNRSKQAAAVDRAARLTAYVMKRTGVPLDHVVPHYHWPQHRFNHHQKNCPRILLDRGRPGPRWQAFKDRVRRYL